MATQGKPLGLSLGDRICLATAQTMGGLVLTTDQAWRSLCLEGVAIEVIRDALDQEKQPLPKKPRHRES